MLNASCRLSALGPFRSVRRYCTAPVVVAAAPTAVTWPSRLPAVVPALSSSAAMGDASQSHGGTPRGVLQGWINAFFAVGVVKKMSLGMMDGLPCCQFELSRTQFARSAGDPQGAVVLCETSGLHVVCMGPTWSTFAECNVTDNCLVHVCGRLTLRPVFNARAGVYDFSHRVDVSEECGHLALLLKEQASTPANRDNDVAAS